MKCLPFVTICVHFLLIANAAHPFQYFVNILRVVSLSILACVAVLASLSLPFILVRMHGNWGGAKVRYKGKVRVILQHC